MSATGENHRRHLALPADFGAHLSANSHEGGFSLFEMLVAVAILALISGIAFPQLQIARSRQTLTEACSAVSLAVARARSEAIRGDRPTRVTLTGPGDALNISQLGATPLPAGAVVDWPRDGVVLFGDGSSSGASGAVSAGTAISRFAIDPATARLKFTS